MGKKIRARVPKLESIDFSLNAHVTRRKGTLRVTLIKKVFNKWSESRNDTEADIAEYFIDLKEVKPPRRYRVKAPSLYKGHPGLCYITTACVEAANLPDDCDELMTIRRFRDQYILSLPNGKQLVREYYDTAPDIVDAISKRSNRNGLFSKIFEQDILPVIDMIKKGDNDRALKHYIGMVRRLKLKYLSVK